MRDPQRVATPAAAAPFALKVRYEPRVRGALGDDVLAVISFAGDAPVDDDDDPRRVRVGLPRLGGIDGDEVWRVPGPVHHGRDGAIRFARSDTLAFGAIEVDERDAGGTEAAARVAYDAIVRHVDGSSHPHLLRIWNYFDAINVGDADDERYRRFCVGRAAGLAPVIARYYPAATAIGRHDGDPRLQVYWLAGAVAGTPLENPRQVSAYQYPRRYGPVSPSFSRAMLAGDTLLVSGTSSVVGHETHHAGDIARQLDETMTNLAHVLDHAHARAHAVPTTFGAGSALKVYLRDPGDATRVDALLRARLGDAVPYVIVAGDICRADLAIEIDGSHAA